jgi:hypothetical protein
MSIVKLRWGDFGILVGFGGGPRRRVLLAAFFAVTAFLFLVTWLVFLGFRIVNQKKTP